MSPAVVKFADFELDVARYELRRRGRRVPMQRIPMDLLILLVERRGELVSRSDIAARIWEFDGQGDVDRNINTAIRKLRQALRDDAEQPRLVETVIGKGYRFIAPVASAAEPVAEVGRPPAEAPSEPPPVHAPEPLVKAPRKGWWGGVVAIGLAVCGFALAAGTLVWRATPPKPSGASVVPFTALPGSETTPAFSPDGKQVAFSWTDAGGSRQHIFIKPLGPGAETQLTSGPGRDSSPSWSPDGRSIAFLRETSPGAVAVYLISVQDGAERKLRDLSRPVYSHPAFCPNGSALAIVDADPPQSPTAVFLLSLNSHLLRRITAPAQDSLGDISPDFSPDGRTLAFLRNPGSHHIRVPYIVLVDSACLPTGPPAMVRSERTDLSGLAWGAGGRSLICSAHGSLLRIPLAGGAAELLPFQDASQPAVARHGNHLIYSRAVEASSILRVAGPGEPGGAPAKLMVSTRYSGAARYSPDGGRIVFVSDRSGWQELWISDGEGQNARQLTFFGRASLGSPRWSPDGRRIAFDSTAEGQANVYVLELAGGSVRRITGDGSVNVRPAWSFDGSSIYFGSNRSGSWQIWKTTPLGGAAIPITQDGGREAIEDAAGKLLYYTRPQPESGVWRIPVSGGKSERVTGSGVQGQWDIGQRGLYYVNDRNELELLELPGRRRVRIPAPELPLPGASVHLGVAPGERWVLLTMPSTSEADLYLAVSY